MQLVGLEVGDGMSYDGALTALTAALSGRGSVGTIRDSAGAVVVEHGPTTVRHEGDPSSSLTATAIDQLADTGIEYAIVDASLASEIETVGVGVEHDDGHLETIEADRLDDTDRLEAVADSIDSLEPHETLGSLVARITEHPDSPRAGALATFTGRVRAENLADARTTHLEYEKYQGVADTELDAIRAELTDREGVYEVLMHHHTGVVPAEEDAVHVVVLAGHRREAFRAVEDGIDLLKERVPIFKKEVTETGEHWAHDRP